MLESFVKRIYFPVSIFLMFAIGFAAVNIFHFAVEDYFQTDIIHNFLLGEEFALSQSILIVSSLFFIAFSFLYTRCHQDIFILSSFKKKVLLLAMAIIGLSIFTYICLVVYSFFSGKSDPYGLIRMLATFFVLFIAIFLMFLRFKANDIFYTKKIILLDNICLFMLLLPATYFTFYFAPPSLMKQVKHDYESAQILQTISGKVFSYYDKNENLPFKLENLSEKGYFKHLSFNIDDVSYRKNTERTYSLCSHFHTDSDDHKRHKKRFRFYGTSSQDLVYKKGLYCFHYEVKKNINGLHKNILVSGSIDIHHK